MILVVITVVATLARAWTGSSNRGLATAATRMNATVISWPILNYQREWCRGGSSYRTDSPFVALGELWFSFFFASCDSTCAVWRRQDAAQTRQAESLSHGSVWILGIPNCLEYLVVATSDTLYPCYCLFDEPRRIRESANLGHRKARLTGQRTDVLTIGASRNWATIR